MFFDTVHLIKNIRNNLLNGKKFVFPGFNFDVCNLTISSEPGYICWQDLHRLYDKDMKLMAHLRKAPKLSFRALHPMDNKQNVSLALAIFHDTTIVACKAYFPERGDVRNFLKLFNTWWTISNSRQQFVSNPMGNAITAYDGKIEFLEKLANYIESWNNSSNFCLSKQTGNALVRTLRAHVLLIKDLFVDGYKYVVMRKLQSDPIENRFSQYRQMSGGRFLVGLREVLRSETILGCRSLLKAGIDVWKHVSTDDDVEGLNEFISNLSVHATELQEVSLDPESADVARLISGFVSRKIFENTKCDNCVEKIISTDSSHGYLEDISRGNLTIPSTNVLYIVSSSFAQLEYIEDKISSVHVKKYCHQALDKYVPHSVISCPEHITANRKIVINTVVNIFFNNKQHQAVDEVRKQQIYGFKKRQRAKN